MKWKINDLDKNKTALSIKNEERRLADCIVRLNRLKKEYEDRFNSVHIELTKIANEIFNIEVSIDNGKKFINQCKEHLTDF